MPYLAESIKCLNYVGIWKSQKLSKCNVIFYDFYTSIVISSLFLFLLSQLLDLSLVVDEFSEFVNNAYSLFFTIAVFVKMINILRCREKLANILSIYETRPFAPLDDKEVDISCRIHKAFRPIYVFGAFFTRAAVIVLITYKIFETRPPGMLPLRSWLPFDLNPLLYWLLASYQFTLIVIGITANWGHNIFYIALMMLTVVSIRRLKHRISLVINKLAATGNDKNRINSKKLMRMEKELLRKCIEYHTALLRLSRSVNNLFSTVLLVQCTFSCISMCVVAFILSKLSLFIAAFVANVGYFVSIFIEIFLLAVFTHQITLEFSDINDAIYKANWPYLSKNSRQYLILIMMNSNKPLVFTCCGLLQFDINVFKSVTKLSYSIYNIL